MMQRFDRTLHCRQWRPQIVRDVRHQFAPQPVVLFQLFNLANESARDMSTNAFDNASISSPPARISPKFGSTVAKFESVDALHFTAKSLQPLRQQPEDERADDKCR